MSFLLRAITLFSLIIISQQALATDPLVIAKVGDPAPGFDDKPGAVFTELSAPVLTKDGERVALVAEVKPESTSAEPAWYFGDIRPDGFFDLKIAARSGMSVNGSTKKLALFWLPDPYAFGDLKPNNFYEIHLDAVTGKLAFIGYLSDENTLSDPYSSDKEKALFIADDNGITLVAKEGPSEFSYEFDGQPYPFHIGFREIKFINDRLLISSSALGSDGDINHGLLIYENGVLDKLLITTTFSEEMFTDAVLGEVSIERIGKIVLNENGIAVAVLYGRVTNEIDGIKDVTLVQARFEPSGQNRTKLDTVISTLEPAPGFPEARVYYDFIEISLNRFDDLAFIANVLKLDEFNKPIISAEPEKVVHWLSLDFPAEGTVAYTGSLAKGYTGQGSNVIKDIYNVQIAGEYLSCVVTYDGDVNNVFGNAGILRTKVGSDEPEDLVFFIGGPSHINGLGAIYSISHILMGTNGDIVTQVSTGEGWDRAILHASPPDSSGSVDFSLIAETNDFNTFICEDSCPEFTPILNTIGFIPRGSPPLNYPGLGGETGFGQWINALQSGWILFTNPFEPSYMEYSVLLNLAQADYGDAPGGELTPAPIDVPHGYAVATHVIDGAEVLGLEIDDGINRINSDLLFQYFGIDDDTENSPDDEDGVEFVTQKETIDLPAPASGFSVDVPVLIAGETVDVLIDASSGDQNAYINAWIDFNRDGIFQTAEQFISSALVPANTFYERYTFQILYNTPFPINAGYTFARFRLSGNPDTPPAGIENSGEVEDYLVKIVLLANRDFGDAPSDGTVHTYPTTLAQDGARHTALANSPLLGENVDYEVDGVPSAEADGDDTEGTDDEDGVILPQSFPSGDVNITVTATMNGKLDAWIDFNQDSDWDDAGEKILDSADVVTGENVLQVTVPQDVVPGTSYARFRISGSGGLTPTGEAQGGEVEDYKITLGEIPTWAGFSIEADGENVFTGSFLDWINIKNQPFVYVYKLEKYVYLPEAFVGPMGAWLWINRAAVAAGADPAWAGYQIQPDGENVFSEDFLGWVNIGGGDYIFSFTMGRFIYLPENLVSASGSWAWMWL